MQKFILRQNVVSDDILIASDKGKIFKGGYIAIVEFNVYKNSWCERKQVKNFRSKKQLFEFLKKQYIFTCVYICVIFLNGKSSKVLGSFKNSKPKR